MYGVGLDKVYVIHDHICKKEKKIDKKKCLQFWNFFWRNDAKESKASWQA